ncbi:hypothetical protein EZ313_17535 [Ramlibacter henchirensis]|uniref:Lectin n=1 Tax=Ramlibacter henchirensis TaxID=204072 RepID=A0A4Z0BVV6_9BURK|nr:hypothetical protein EZ313_17535 [Ramlibacter henchirensis]
MQPLPAVLAAVCSATLLSACAGSPPAGSGATGGTAARNNMSFFVTSANPGKGADFGGIAGADRHCQALASSVGAGQRTWRAYLSSTAGDGRTPVNARDRIGRGPWQNAKGAVVASNVDELHGQNKLTKETALTEKGETVSGSGDPVNQHDILTGSTPDGRATTAATGDTTCRNWTSGAEGSAIVGHHDRRGLRDDEPSRSWNSSHGSRGCSLEALRGTGGGGLMYCFAAD